ncbi:serine hydrolase [Streptomyces olivaceoviridis]
MLSLDDPLDRWLPTAPRTGITLLHLARHTSGLPRLPPGRFPPPRSVRGIRPPTAPRWTACYPGSTHSSCVSPAERRSTQISATPCLAPP